MKRSIAPAPNDVVLAVDSSKLGGRAVAVGIEWDRVDVLVTELDPGDDRLDAVPRPRPVVVTAPLRVVALRCGYRRVGDTLGIGTRGPTLVARRDRRA